ncbi:MAG: hypothetical protein M9894_22540 [Planctomycetes bacterium]|nr:hypothetical protein [Planctomycetota bacterium]
MLVRRFVGDRRSMEVRSVDGRVWSVALYDRGRLIKVPRATTEQVEQLVVDRRLQPTDRLLMSARVTSV